MKRKLRDLWKALFGKTKELEGAEIREALARQRREQAQREFEDRVDRVGTQTWQEDDAPAESEELTPNGG